MKIAFIINDHETEKGNYTTPALGFAAYKRDHEVYFIGVGELAYASNGHLLARCKTVSGRNFKSQETYFKAVQKQEFTRISSADLDVLFLRNDPSDEIDEREWAQNAAFIFGEIAMRDKVLVLNHPSSLAGAVNKMYFQHFPEILRPKTIITRDQQEIKEFFKEQKQRMILKPLQGSGGKNVFMMDKKNEHNLAQTIDAICRDGFVIAQEYLPKAKEGDTRLFLMNGVPLQAENGQYAIMQRVNTSGDIRSNIHAGGRPQKAKMTDKIAELAEIVRPKLVQDGMFLVGLDIVGEKLMEINVFSPGGLNVMGDMYDCDFSVQVIKSIEKKVQYNNTYEDYLFNSRLATL
ncbi:MAG: glutathione synthase [Flavobacteriales bacterium]|jgi:glutathione synthase|uniref:glutathione synthetase n=1 Tax=Candidatus Ulvibacter alkanivorans TaxID=2267620 RepID=UPI000DF2A13B|nr:glutathione synthetase [Candidatus Ulvibacter alkanivorans]MCH2490971.1 glutathione synthase [Flavobacteriales bacterium]